MIDRHLSSKRPVNPQHLRRKFVDLGSGAGESTIEAARRGYDSLGVEINPALLLMSKISAVKTLGIRNNNCRFNSSNLLNLPLAPYDVIFMFGVKPLLAVIGPRLIREMTPGSLLLLYRFKLTKETLGGDDEGSLEVVENKGEMTLYQKKGGDEWEEETVLGDRSIEVVDRIV